MANFNFNKIILGGRLTADPELKTTPSGISVTTFSIAVNKRVKEGEEAQADFFNVTAWRQTAEFITRYFRKASSICVVGELHNRSWVDQQGQKRYATEIVASEAFLWMQNQKCHRRRKFQGRSHIHLWQALLMCRRRTRQT